MKDRMRIKIKYKKGASGFSFAGRAVLGILGFLLARAPGVPAEGQPYLVRDINEAGDGSNLGGFAVVGNQLFFSADDGTRYELWVTDGTPGGTMAWRAHLGQPETWRAGVPSAHGDRQIGILADAM